VKAGVPAQLLRNRPDVRQAEQELRASGADVNAAHAAFYPSLSISASAGFQAFNPAFLFSPQSLAYSVFGNLMAPLINRAALKAAFSNASARQQEALASYQQSILRAFMEVYTELSLISNLENIRQLKTEESRVLTESIETSSELFRSGRASYLEVLMTQQNALRAKLELVDTRKRQYHAMLNLYRGLGGGWRQ
jgi:outer membrane protein TolC